MTSGTVVGTPSYQAGLDRGDRLISADGRPIAGPEEWTALVAARAPGDTISLVFHQRGREVRAVLRLVGDPRLEVRPVELTGKTLTDNQRAFRAAWLGSRAR